MNYESAGMGLTAYGEIVIYAEDGYDGVYSTGALLPVSLEIMAKGIVPAVSREEGIPVMTIL